MKQMPSKSACLSLAQNKPAIEKIHSPYLKETVYRWTDPSGLPVLFVPKTMTTTVAQFTVAYGAADLRFTPIGETRMRTFPDGIAHFLEHKMFTAEDGGDVSERFSALGGDANAWTSYDKTTYLFKTAEHPYECLRELLYFVTHPTFREESVAHERSIIREEILMGEDNPWEYLDRRTLQALYPHHPVHRRICGTPRSIEKITPEVLYTAYYTFYRPENMFLTVCGNLEAEKMAEVVNISLQDWRQRLPAQNRPPHRAAQKRNDAVHPTSVAHAAISQPMLTVAWRDRFTATNPIERLRHEIKLTYISEWLFSSAGTFFGTMYEKGLLNGYYDYSTNTFASVGYHCVCAETDDPEKVFGAYQKTVEQARRNGISEADFDRTKKILFAGFVGNFDSTEDIADCMLEAQNGGVGLFDELQILMSMTRQEINECIKTALLPSDTVYAVLLPKGKKSTDS